VEATVGGDRHPRSRARALVGVRGCDNSAEGAVAQGSDWL
jgi:hypothetical protein